MDSNVPSVQPGGKSEAIPGGPTREERLHALDNLRAWAMFLGILLHAAISFMVLDFPWAARDVRQHQSFDLMVWVIHGFRMQLFFFLAGFFGRLLCERLGAGGFAKHRLLRVGLPFLGGMVVLIPLCAMIFVLGVTQATEPMNYPENNAKGLAAIPTMHLWFLEYLLVFYVLALIVVQAARRLPDRVFACGDRVADFVLGSWWRALILVPPTILCLQLGSAANLEDGDIEQTGMSIIPKPVAVAYYGLFFLVGWWLHRRRHHLERLTQNLPVSFSIATVAILASGVIIDSEKRQILTNPGLWKNIGFGCSALYAWLMTFAVTGWFLRFGGQHRPVVRYLADASYWCYLAHIPLVMWLQIIVAQWPIPSWIKFTFICALTMALLLVSYDWFVRYSFIGTALNGRRDRPKAVASA